MAERASWRLILICVLHKFFPCVLLFSHSLQGNQYTRKYIRTRRAAPLGKLNCLVIKRYVCIHEAVYQGLDAVVSFTLAERAAAERFLASCQLISEATSFGGLHTMAERRARWGGDAVTEGFIRLSAGIEHIDDLLADLEQGLNTLSAY